MNVGELLRERDRLLSVLDEAKSARSKLKQVNVLIAMYGDPPNVDHVATNGAAMVQCPECGAGPYKGRQGLSMHEHRIHTGTITTGRQKSKATKK